MARRRRSRLPAATKGMVVLDSGAITKIAFADLLACSIVEELSGRGWAVCLPAVALSEVITGAARTDAPVERLIKQVGNTVECGERLGKVAGVLRTRAIGRKRKSAPSGVDAIVAAVAAACQPSIVLTTDVDDLSALLAATDLATVIAV